MKKLIALLLVAVMCLSLSACGRKEDEIRNALQGSWVAEWTVAGKNVSRYYTFKGERYTTGGVTFFGNLGTGRGSFEINESTIKLITDDGLSSTELKYTYDEKSGEITLWLDDDTKFEKGIVNIIT